jgi:hypothetical protein
MNTETMHRSGLYPAAPPAPRRRVRRNEGFWLEHLPSVVGVVVFLTMWIVTVAGVLYAA